ncbi:hypothetical protein [Luteimonas sp. 3794]|uniref:hypothetical protein n=1 Tax=Luteimonas sp. 3794 TaxID=2817730 RepID=UPI00285AABAB|nr:hypothetical protein [Luteimonas sp. 3794]MDR6991920.1 hypothetical protein [Luteimonas sp. 3794]
MTMPRMSPTEVSRLPQSLAAATLLVALSACTPPPDSPTEKPTEPRAAQIRDAIREPLDEAHATQHAVDADARRTREAIDAAGG